MAKKKIKKGSKYPPKKTRKNTKSKKPNIIFRIFGLFFKIFLAIFLISAFLGLLFFTYCFITTSEVTDGNFWTSKNTTKIYDRDGELLQVVHGKNIAYVELEDISDYYLEGLIAAEDSNFYTHTGVDMKGMVRATYQTLFTESDSGGSTLTMQLAKNLYLQPSPKIDKEGNYVYDDDGAPVMEYPYNNGLEYKVKQMVYAWKIEAKYDKNKILANYVNSLGFDGQNGIEKASEYYFGVEAKYLNLSQGAMLAGMTQSPANYNPYKDIEAATARRNVVLDNMLKDKKITEKEYNQAKEEKIEDTLVDHEGETVNEDYEIVKPYLDEIYLELNEVFGPEFDINQADASIYTPLDYDLQEETYHIINNDYGTIGYESEYLQAGSATVDTETGEILAIGGGREGVDIGPDQNYGVSYIRQPGSTSKPIVDYGPAIEYLDWSTHHLMEDKAVNYTGGPAVENAYRAYYGTMSIQEALSRSTNTIALQTFQAVAQSPDGGVDKIEKFMSDLGIEDSKNINEAYSIGGWANGTTPLELAGAYSAFGNGGEYNEPHAIRRVEFSPTSQYYDEYGAVYEMEYKSNSAMSTSTAYMVTKMLNPTLPTAITSDVYIKGLGDQGVKTGTSNWPTNDYGIPEGAPRDKWVAGYNADVTTVIWTGYSGEYESQGYYFDSYGMWSYDLYKGIMNAVVNSEKEYLHNGSLTKSSEVYEATLNGVPYYYKKGTSEYEEEKAAEEKAQKEKEEKEKEEKAAEEKRKAEEEAAAQEEENNSTGDKQPVSLNDNTDEDDSFTSDDESQDEDNPFTNNDENDSSSSDDENVVLFT